MIAIGSGAELMLEWCSSDPMFDMWKWDERYGVKVFGHWGYKSSTPKN